MDESETAMLVYGMKVGGWEGGGGEREAALDFRGRASLTRDDVESHGGRCGLKL